MLMTGCDKDPVEEIPATLVEQTIEFKIGKEDDYTEPIFDSTKTSVTLFISAENMDNGENRILWDTLLALRPLRDYPSQTSPIVVSKSIKTLLQKMEILRLSRNTRYEDRDRQVFQEYKGETVPRNIPFISVEIGL
jgi:hypothetical protein